MELSMHIKQNLSLSPQLLQSMRVLRMSDAELAEYIENCVQENPMLEAEASTGEPEPQIIGSCLPRDYVEQPSYTGEDVSAGAAHAELPDVRNETLYDYLMSQLRMAK